MNKYLDYLPEKKNTDSKRPMSIGKLLLIIVLLYALACWLYWSGRANHMGGINEAKLDVFLFLGPPIIAFLMAAYVVEKRRQWQRKSHLEETPNAHGEARP